MQLSSRDKKLQSDTVKSMLRLVEKQPDMPSGQRINFIIYAYMRYDIIDRATQDRLARAMDALKPDERSLIGEQLETCKKKS